MSNSGKPFNPRIAISEKAMLVANTGEQIACTLLDISSDGFRAKLDTPHNPIEINRLVANGKTYGIEVRWATGLELGGRIL